MKLSEAAELCEANSRAFTEVYKIYNFKDDDDLRAYCEFVIHEPVEWMRGFPGKWSTVSHFGRLRAAFHKLMKHSAVCGALGADFCHRVHETVWDAFKSHLDSILEKRNQAAARVVNEIAPDAPDILEAFGEAETEVSSDGIESDAESIPAAKNTGPVNSVSYSASPDSYKQKYRAALAVLKTLLSAEGDENARLRAALLTLLSEQETA